MAAPSLIGRDAELAEIIHLLTRRQTRWLTLTGPGGVGKSALATAAAANLAPHFRDGVFTVELAVLQYPQLALDLLARTVGLPTDSEEPLLSRLQTFLQTKALLLYLDNWEHLLRLPLANCLLAVHNS